MAEQGELELSGDFIKRSVGRPISPRRYRDVEGTGRFSRDHDQRRRILPPESSSAEPRPFAAASGDSGH
jgi:hypothetical protein